jgi:hypothetical protein
MRATGRGSSGVATNFAQIARVVESGGGSATTNPVHEEMHRAGDAFVRLSD